MSKREWYLRKLEETKKRDKELAKLRAREKSYSSSGMDCERMPLGCWAVIGVIVFLVILGIGKFLK